MPPTMAEWFPVRDDIQVFKYGENNGSNFGASASGSAANIFSMPKFPFFFSSH